MKDLSYIIGALNAYANAKKSYIVFTYNNKKRGRCAVKLLKKALTEHEISYSEYQYLNQKKIIISKVLDIIKLIDLTKNYIVNDNLVKNINKIKYIDEKITSAKIENILISSDLNLIEVVKGLVYGKMKIIISVTGKKIVFDYRQTKEQAYTLLREILEKKYGLLIKTYKIKIKGKYTQYRMVINKKEDVAKLIELLSDNCYKKIVEEKINTAYKPIQLKYETYKKLQDLKMKMVFGSYNDVIEMLIEEYQKGVSRCQSNTK